MRGVAERYVCCSREKTMTGETSMDMSDGDDVAMGDIGMTEKSGTENAGHPNAKIPSATTPQEAGVELNAELEDKLDGYCPGDEQLAAMRLNEG
jgi:hypothetical protein